MDNDVNLCNDNSIINASSTVVNYRRQQLAQLVANAPPPKQSTTRGMRDLGEIVIEKRCTPPPIDEWFEKKFGNSQKRHKMTEFVMIQ